MQATLSDSRGFDLSTCMLAEVSELIADNASSKLAARADGQIRDLMSTLRPSIQIPNQWRRAAASVTETAEYPCQ